MNEQEQEKWRRRKIVLDIDECQRCGEAHANVEHKPFTLRPTLFSSRFGMADDTSRISHWALCPTNGEPILASLRWEGEPGFVEDDVKPI